MKGAAFAAPRFFPVYVLSKQVRVEVWHENIQVALGQAVRVDLAEGTARFQGPEVLGVGYVRAILEFREKESLDLLGGHREYEELEAQNLEIMVTREVLRNLPKDGPPYSYGER